MERSDSLTSFAHSLNRRLLRSTGKKGRNRNSAERCQIVL